MHIDAIRDEIASKIPNSSCPYGGPEKLYLPALMRAYSRAQRYGYDSPRYRYAMMRAEVINSMMKDAAETAVLTLYR